MAPGELHPEPAAADRAAVGSPTPSLADEKAPGAPGRRRQLLGLGLVFVLLLAGTAAWLLWQRQEDLTGPGVYQGTGMVLAVIAAPSPLDPERPIIILQHEPIPDLMDKGMTHPFLVRSPRLLRGIAPGAHVRFTLKDTPGALLVVHLEVMP